MAPSAPVKAVDLALATIARYDRPDLEARLRQARSRLLDEHVRVLVVGEFKQGKSLLVNGLVRAPVCPVHDDVATSVPTMVRFADPPVAALVRAPAPESADDAGERRTERVEVPIEELADHVAETGNPGNRQRWHHAEIGLPRNILAGGLELVDTPGVGGLSSVHGAATMAALPSADAVLLVSDASQEYTRPEIEFLRQATKVCPNVACVLTKIDLYPEWRRIAELDRAHLSAANVDAELLSVSSTLRVHSIRTGDADLDTESGFPALVSYLRERVVGQADLLARRSTVHDVLMVTGQLAGTLRAEQTTQQDPEKAQELIAQLTEAQQRSAALKERSARWQHTLNDGVADLNADIDYDLRDRMREITRQAEEEVDGGDPKKTWDKIAGWVEQEVASAASANIVWATQRARWLAGQVADHFSEEEDRVLPRLRTEVADALGSVRGMHLRAGEPFGIGQKAFTGLRGGYVGILMVGVLGGSLFGLPLLSAYAIGAGVLMGGKAVTDERRRIVTRRQHEAKTAVRRYIDDVIFQAGKESKDMLRRVQRDLRDHFTTQAEEMNRSLGDSLRAAEKAVKASTSDRQRRLTEIRAELERLETLQQRVRTLLPGEQSTQPAAERSAHTPRGEEPAAAQDPGKTGKN